MKVYEALARFFREEGVTDAFGLMGNTTMEWWLAMEQIGVNMHTTRHEGPAVTMAYGWTIATREPGVACVSRGPGVTQLGTALTVATRARVPMVVYVGDSNSGDEQEDQYFDHRAFVEVTGAGFLPLGRASDADMAVCQAFYRARVESRPIVLNVPRQVANAEYPGDADHYARSKTLVRPVMPLAPDPAAVRRAAALVVESQRPVVIMGTGAAAPAAREIAVRLGDRIDALFATTLPNKAGFESAWNVGVAGGYATRTAQSLFEDADLVIGVGASLNRHTLGYGRSFPNARYIQVDTRPPYPMGTGRSADVYLEADAATALEAIDTAVASRYRANPGYRTAEVRAALAEPDHDPSEFPIEAGRLDPRAAMQVIDAGLPADVGVICGLGHQAGFTIPMLRKPRPIHMTMTSFGCIGNALPAAIGAAAANHPRPLVAVEGDAGAMMNLGELETAHRMGLKLLLVVMNDEGLGAETWEFIAHDVETTAANVPSPDFAAVGRAFGGDGRLARTLDEVAAGVRDFIAGHGIYVLDVRTSAKVPSVIVRRNHFHEPI
jgi:thiamine pyrophosphate-dependent acetolactate synthase large subunit-like protein